MITRAELKTLTEQFTRARSIDQRVELAAEIRDAVEHLEPPAETPPIMRAVCAEAESMAAQDAMSVVGPAGATSSQATTRSNLVAYNAVAHAGFARAATLPAILPRDLPRQLSDLARLHQGHQLTDAEFQEAKRKVLQLHSRNGETERS